MLDYEFLGNTVLTWLIALGITLGLWCILLIVRRVLTRMITHIAGKSDAWWSGLPVVFVERAQRWFLFIVALIAGSRPLNLTAGVDEGLWFLLVAAGLVQIGWWAHCMVGSLIKRQREQLLRKDPAKVTTIGALGLLAQAVLWLLVALLLLANAGVEITPLIAGLGVGGLALALAVQTILSDLLASLSIIFDKPFVVGDFLIIGDLMGSVEHIGLKTTRIRSLSGEQLVFANNDLLASRIRNFGRMRERRATFEIGVTYETPREKLARIPEILKAAVETQPKTRFDRSHFTKFGPYSLDFETVYYVQVPDMNEYLNIQQAINLRIFSDFADEGIDFAYPTQTIHGIPAES